MKRRIKIGVWLNGNIQTIGSAIDLYHVYRLLLSLKGSDSWWIQQSPGRWSEIIFSNEPALV